MKPNISNRNYLPTALTMCCLGNCSMRKNERLFVYSPSGMRNYNNYNLDRLTEGLRRHYSFKHTLGFIEFSFNCN